jgi:hypothetical protein
MMAKNDFINSNIDGIKAGIKRLEATLASLEALPKIAKCTCNLEGAEIYWGGDADTCVLSCTACRRSTNSAAPSSSIALWNKMNGK